MQMGQDPSEVMIRRQTTRRSPPRRPRSSRRHRRRAVLVVVLAPSAPPRNRRRKVVHLGRDHPSRTKTPFSADRASALPPRDGPKRRRPLPLRLLGQQQQQQYKEVASFMPTGPINREVRSDRREAILPLRDSPRPRVKINPNGRSQRELLWEQPLWRPRALLPVLMHLLVVAQVFLCLLTANRTRPRWRRLRLIRWQLTAGVGTTVTTRRRPTGLLPREEEGAVPPRLYRTLGTHRRSGWSGSTDPQLRGRRASIPNTLFDANSSCPLVPSAPSPSCSLSLSPS